MSLHGYGASNNQGTNQSLMKENIVCLELIFVIACLIVLTFFQVDISELDNRHELINYN